MKAIETKYRGRRFRSRTEARWAVFFDALETPWEYEKEGFELPSGRYLPDFWLPEVGVGCWFEVKGVEPTDHEKKLAKELAEVTQSPVFIFAGQPWAEAPREVNECDGTPFDKVRAAYFMLSKDRVRELVRKAGWVESWFIKTSVGIGFFPNQDHVYTNEKFVICGECGSVGIFGGECYMPCQVWYGGHYPASRLDLMKRCVDGRGVTSYQDRILCRSCDRDGLVTTFKQVDRLKRAFDKASEARFEFGENG